jgi:hypothetical protein
MTLLAPKIRSVAVILLECASICAQAQSEVPPATPAATPAQIQNGGQPSAAADKPIPDVVAMMHDVENNQRKSEAVEKDYIYHSIATEQEIDGHGQVKKTTVTESDHYWVNGVPVRRIVKKNGKDLSPDEIAKENERIDKLTAKASEKRQKADDAGKQTDPRGNEVVTVSRLVELGSFSNARRVQLNGRDTIAVDFTGDPKAKTRNRTEEVIRDMVGTSWIDEQDHVLAKVEGHFVNAFKVGGGLIVNVQKDTQFSMVQTKVNGEVWLPERLEGQGSIHALLFFGFNGRGQIVNSDYRKFRTSSTILPGVTRVELPQSQEDHVHP